MDYLAAKKQLQARNLPQVYLISGQEPYLMNELLQEILNALLSPEEKNDCLTIYEDDPELNNILMVVESAPFFGSKNVILVRDTKLFKVKKQAADNEEETADKKKKALQERIRHMPDFSYIIWLAKEKADKRTALYKAVQANGLAVDIPVYRAWEVRTWLMDLLKNKGIKMEAEALEYLLNVVNLMANISLGFIANELDKIILYIYPKKNIGKNDLLNMLSKVPEVSIFAMLEAMCEKNSKTALTLLHDQLREGQPSLVILSLLARQVRQLMQIKEQLAQGEGKPQIADKLKVPLFIADKLMRQSKNFSYSALRRVMLQFAGASVDIKYSSGGETELDKIIIQVCR